MSQDVALTPERHARYLCLRNARAVADHFNPARPPSLTAQLLSSSRDPTAAEEEAIAEAADVDSFVQGSGIMASLREQAKPRPCSLD